MSASRAYRRARRRLRAEAAPSLTEHSWKPAEGPDARRLPKNVVLDCAWGRLVFGYTFRDNAKLAETLVGEKPGRRDIALYIRDPHVVLSMAPQELFLDPSHTYRIRLSGYRAGGRLPRGFHIRPVRRKADVREINRIFSSRGMVSGDAEFLWKKRASRTVVHLVAEDEPSGRILGTVTGVDHRKAFGDPENGSSLWCLAVDPQASAPGVGEALVRYLCEYFLARGRVFMDLSVMHDNRQAIALYEKLGFRRIAAFCVKRKNPINEPLYTAPKRIPKMNPYADLLVREALQRGISIEVLDRPRAVFQLTHGGRTVRCRESLSDLTTAVSMTLCDDKSLTNRWLRRAGLKVPAQKTAGGEAADAAFLRRCKRIVVKPARGEQGAGITVGVRSVKEMRDAVERARAVCPQVLLERFHEGEDLRVVMIDFKMVAAAVRRPASVVGNGQDSVLRLIEKQSRRRQSATGGESRIPLDAETERCVRDAGLGLDSVLEAGRALAVRRTANLHTGGTIHDATARVHPKLVDACERAARALEIPVVGLDLLVPRLDGPRYTIIEANERVGLANHAPQPTAERFIDLLFPQTADPREVP